MLNNFTSSLRSLPDASDTIKTYLNIRLNEESPFITVNEKLHLVTESINYDHPSAFKATEQFILLIRVIEKLYESKRLMSLNTLKMDNRVVVTSSSSDSIPTDPSFSKRINNSFTKALKTSDESNNEKAYLTNDHPSRRSNSDYSKEKKFDYKLNMILATAREVINSCAREDSANEKFHRKVLAAALECHVNNHIKPLTLTTISHLFKRKDNDWGIKNLSTEAINTLVLFWYDPENEAVKASINGLPKEDLKIIESHYFINRSLCDYPKMTLAVQELTLRALQHNPGLVSLGEDIFRQLAYIQIYEPATKKVFSYQKAELENEETDLILIERELLNFKNMISSFLSMLGQKEDFTKSILSKIDTLLENIDKSLGRFSVFFAEFMNYLVDINNSQDLEFNLATKKLYFLLLTLSQNTYFCASGPLFHKFRELKLKTELGSHNRKIRYCSENLRITLESSIKVQSEKRNDFEFFIVNSMTSTIKNPSHWNSEILIKIHVKNLTKKDEIKKEITRPLTAMGFKTQTIFLSEKKKFNLTV